MWIELDEAAFGRALPLLVDADLPAPRSIAQGATPGRVWVDDSAAPQAALILGDFNFAYLLGMPDGDARTRGLADLLAGTVFPAIQATPDPSLVLYPLTTVWAARLGEVAGRARWFPAARRHFRFDAERFTALDLPPLADGFRLARIDADLLQKYAPLTGEVNLFWRREADYLARGVGVCALVGDSLAGWCLSILAPDARREITIFTAEEYRRGGVGLHTGAAYLQACLDQGLEPVWECWDANHASDALARKLGFVPTGDHPVFFFDLTPETTDEGDA